MKMHFGKFRGREVGSLPTDYLRWLSTIHLEDDLHAAVHTELARRGERSVLLSVPRSLAPVVSEVIERGFKAAARVHHPDAGGSTERMQQLNAAVALLRSALCS